MAKNKFPPGWDKEKIKNIVSHYETQTEDEAVKEDEAIFENYPESVIEVPKELIPIVREFIARRENSLRIIENLNKNTLKTNTNIQQIKSRKGK